jgi:2-hydroxy-3-oxopropionate reductase
MESATNPTAAVSTTAAPDISTSTVGFIGLGVMGRPMALNLRRAGYRLTVCDRSADPLAALTDAGATAVDSPAAVLDASDVVITCLPGPAEVEAVVLDQSFLDRLRPGQVVVDMTTSRPDLNVRIDAEARSRGAAAVDAPVSGGEPGAIEGTLSIMVGAADPATFQLVEPILRTMGSTVQLVGSAGAGQIVKAANQMLVGGTMLLVAEALTVLRATDVDTTAALTVLSGGLAGSEVLRRKFPAMLERAFGPGFRIDLHAKDIGIALDIARTQQVPIPLTAQVMQYLVSAQAHGRGALDHAALVTVIEQLAARTD